MTAEVEENLQFPLKVTIAAMSERTRTLIEYYISRNGNRLFSIAESTDTADVVMIDHDHPGTAARLAASTWHSEIPLVVLTVDDAEVDGAIMVRKPLNSASLENAAQQALQQLRNQITNIDEGARTALIETLDGTQPDLAPDLPKLTRRAQAPRQTRPETPTYFRTNDAAIPGPPTLPTVMKIQRYRDKIELLCGPSRTLDELRDPFNTTHRFNSANCVSRRIAKVLLNPTPGMKVVQLKLPEADIYVLPTLNKVYTSLSLEYKRNVKRLFSDWGEDDVRVLEYDQTNVNEVIDILNNSPRFSFGGQSFCWLSALFSAQGRLPLDFDLNSLCQLRHWPNLTRLELTPDSIELAAAWTEQAATLSQIIERVQCEPHHATSFLNAACTIQLMDVEPSNEQ